MNKYEQKNKICNFQCQYNYFFTPVTTHTHKQDNNSYTDQEWKQKDSSNPVHFQIRTTHHHRLVKWKVDVDKRSR